MSAYLMTRLHNRQQSYSSARQAFMYSRGVCYTETRGHLFSISASMNLLSVNPNNISVSVSATGQKKHSLVQFKREFR